MKVIDLLNKIANGEEVPKKIRLGNNPDIFYYQEDINSYKSYDGEYLISEWLCNSSRLNFEIKEDKKIKKIGKLNQVEDKQNLNNYILRDKINEIIDEINKMEEGLE